MNEAQRSVIQRHVRQLADDIMITEDLMAALYQKKIFERGMIETIKAEKTPSEQIHKLLSMLPRRGPDAFDQFIDVIHNDYPWLAAMLESSYKAQLELSHSNMVDRVLMCPSAKTDKTEIDGNMRQSIDISADPDIKQRVGKFIHKQFGLSKRVSQIDKKVMEKWFADQIQTERKRLQPASPTIEDNQPEMIDRACNTSPTHLSQDVINEIYEKVKYKNDPDIEPNNTKEATSDSDGDTDEGRGSDHVDGGEPLLVTTDMLSREINKLLKKMDQTGNVFNLCYYLLGDPDSPQTLPNVIREYMANTREIESELKTEKKRIEKMLTEMYDYSKTIHRLETTRQHHRRQLADNVQTIEKLKEENAVIAEKFKSIEAINIQHAEKEKTLVNLRKMVQDLKTSKADENANYKYGQSTARNYKRPAARTQNRRGSLIDTGLNNSIRRNVGKPTRNIKPVSRPYPGARY